MADDDVAVVVIDNGSYKIKAGFAGDDCHRSVFSTVVGRPDRPAYQVSASDHKDFYVGDDAQHRRSTLNLNYPIEHGIITNWDDMEIVWQRCFNDELRVDPAEHPIIITEPPLNPKPQKERTVQVMFEKLNACAFFLALSSELSLYAACRVSGITVDVGDGVSCAMTIYAGRCIKPATRRLDFGGRDLTLNLQKMLHEKGYDFVNNSELEIVRKMKEKLCYVALDCKQEARNVRDEKFELPDGNTITIGKERFMCPEALFGPIPGFPERIREGIESFVPRTTKVKVIAVPERKSSVWIGGSILGSLSTFQTHWISKQEYEEYGPTIVHRRD